MAIHRRFVIAAATAVAALAVGSPSTAAISSEAQATSTQSGTPSTFAAGTSKGAVRIVSRSGRVVRTIAPATGQPVTDVSMTTDRSRVYFARARDIHACSHRIFSVPAAGGRTRFVARGNSPEVSPGGALLAFARRGANCGADSLVVRNLRTGRERVFANHSFDNGEPWVIYDLTWRPDGKAIIVTMGWENFGQLRAVLLDRAPADLDSAPVLPVRRRYPEDVAETDYVGRQLLIAGSCCYVEGVPSSRVVRRDSNTGQVTSLFRVAGWGMRSMSANSAGQVLYLQRGSTWRWDGSGRPVRIAGAYTAVDW